ncbi:MAG: type II secretion system protein GspN [Candidatus Electrothrix sp. AS4_5]|nr:type II secretion system protein GspN [Candidatus Electrothrix gigas]
MLMKLLKFSGYLLYTLVVLVFLLWYKFPVDALTFRIEKDLNTMTPSLHWVVQEVTLVPPLDIHLHTVQVFEKNEKSKDSAKKEKRKLFTIQTMTLRPALGVWKDTGNITAKYKLNLLSGTVAGHLGLRQDRSTLEYDGKMQEITINKELLPFLQEDYQRGVQGILSGTFSGKRKMTEKHHALQGTFQVTKGTVGLHYPVLGMNELVFDRLATQLTLNAGKMTLSKGKMTSPTFTADFQGDIYTAVPCRLSRVQITGSFQPKPAFIASVDSPSLARLLKKEMAKGKGQGKGVLPFTVNGMLQQPGIVFPSLPAVFNRQMGQQKKQLLRKQLRQLPKRSR